LQNHTVLSLIGINKLGKEKKEAKKRKEKKEYEPLLSTMWTAGSIFLEGYYCL
jgi:hypothetical protein